MAGQLGRNEIFRLYSSEISYFSGKVRPALRYKRLPFVDLLATAEAYRTVIRPRTGFSFIPIVITPDDEALQDTSDILDELERRYPDPPLYPRTPLQRVVAYLWELYADEFLILPALHYRWSFPESEAKARADFAATNGDPALAGRFADGVKGFIAMGGVLPETIPALEAHTAELLADLEAHLAEHAYLLGGRPSLADLALLGPLYAHLYLDAVPARLLRERAPRVCHWIERMNHPDPDGTGDWLAEDALAATMRPMLERIGRDAIPILLDTVRAVDAWAASQDAAWDEPPRAVGMHRTALRGATFERYTSPYTLWMTQRPRNAYDALGPSERVSVDRALAGTGCEALFAARPAVRLAKRGFRLARADGSP
jgi:glutathione S-transferase